MVGLLGKGSFGKVYKVKRVSDDVICILKVVDLEDMTEEEHKEALIEVISNPGRLLTSPSVR